MSLSDPLADFLTRVRNSGRIGARMCSSPHSKLREAVASVLSEEGYLTKYTVKTISEAKKQLEVELRYYKGSPAASTIKRLSTPGCRVYIDAEKLKRLCARFRGVYIVSTSKGVVSGLKALEWGVGGELLCMVA